MAYKIGRSSSAASPPSPMFAAGSEAGVAGRSFKIGVAGGITAGVGVVLRGAAERRAGVRLATLRFATARFGAGRFATGRFATGRFALVLAVFAAPDRAAAPRREAAARLDDALVLAFAFVFALFGVGLRAFGFLTAILSTPLNVSGNSRILAGVLACHRQQAICHER